MAESLHADLIRVYNALAYQLDDHSKRFKDGVSRRLSEKLRGATKALLGSRRLEDLPSGEIAVPNGSLDTARDAAEALQAPRTSLPYVAVVGDTLIQLLDTNSRSIEANPHPYILGLQGLDYNPTSLHLFRNGVGG